jgi:hypothetical protein
VCFHAKLREIFETGDIGLGAPRQPLARIAIGPAPTIYARRNRNRNRYDNPAAKCSKKRSGLDRRRVVSVARPAYLAAEIPSVMVLKFVTLM